MGLTVFPFRHTVIILVLSKPKLPGRGPILGFINGRLELFFMALRDFASLSITDGRSNVY